MTRLRSALERYVSMRRGLGYKYIEQARLLRDFISFMETRNAATITTNLALTWATLRPGVHASAGNRLAVVRAFARHLAGIDPKTEIPPNGIIPPRMRPKPYIYSEEQVEALLEAALTLRPLHRLNRWTYHYLFGLIATTGMRLSEATGLQRDDVDLKNGVLTVRRSKFGKSRLIPLHPTTNEALRNYAERRDRHLGSRCCAHFFVGAGGGRLLRPNIARAFLRLSRELGLRSPGASVGPRMHDLRHSFAVRTLLAWYREGLNVEQRLPVLSTYLGHTSVRDTYWYLSTCPELMQEVTRRIERRNWVSQ